MTAIAENFHDAPIPRTANGTTWLGLLCMSAAVLSSILKGVWEMARPILVTPETFASAPPLQPWIYCLLEVFKSAGFLAGLFGFYIFATKRGRVMKVFMVLAVLGGIFYAGVWMWMTATTRFTIIYVLGGMWYQMVAPVALGIAALSARRIAWWKAVFAIVVGVINSQIFPLLGPAKALLVQGVVWLIFGYLVYSFPTARLTRQQG